MYRGNGDLRDKLDFFIMDYMKRYKLYVPTIFIAHGVYIIGRGWAVKVQ